jgi:hypothetical protein
MRQSSRTTTPSLRPAGASDERHGIPHRVVAKYGRRLAGQHHLLRALDDLRGCDLVCWCAPRPCHGDLLLRLANASCDERIAWWRTMTATA